MARKRSMGRTILQRLGRGAVPGGRGVFNRPRIARHGGHGGHGGGGHLLLSPLKLALLALGILAKLLKKKQKKTKGVGRTHAAAHQPRVKHIRRPKVSRTHKPGKPDLSGSKASVAKRRSNHYITGVYNVANRKLKRTRLL